MKIYDGLMLNDELDLLELRLMEIGDLVDYVVVVESNYTFRGDSKPLWFQEFRHRFNHWESKIRHVVSDPTMGSDPTVDNFIVPSFEYAQRRGISEGFYGADMTDIVMISDVDEIPSRRVLDRIRRQPPASPHVFEQKLFYYSVNWMHKKPWYGTIAMPRGLSKEMDIQEIRDSRGSLPGLEHGGWHFSWMGNADDIKHKLLCHTVADDLERFPSDIKVPDPEGREHIEHCLETGADLFHRVGDAHKKDFVALDPGGTHPATIERWLQDHPKYEVKLPADV